MRDYTRLRDLLKVIGPYKNMSHTPRILADIVYECMKLKTMVYKLQESNKALREDVNKLIKKEGWL